MAILGYMGFTVNIIDRKDGDPRNVLIWAGGGTEAITEEMLAQDLTKMFEHATDEDKFKHWTEVWER